MKTCVVLAPADEKQLESLIGESKRHNPNKYEIRADFVKNVKNKHDLVFSTLKRLGISSRSIITLRPEGQGGKFEGKDAEKIAILQHALEIKPEFLDIELDFAKRNPEFVHSIKKQRKILCFSFV